MTGHDFSESIVTSSNPPKNGRSPFVGPSNAKSKHRERLSQQQHASENQLSNRVGIDSDEDEGQTKRMAELIVSKSPKKKRKITSEAERSPTQTLLIRQGEKKSNDGDFKVDSQNGKLAKD